MGAAGIDSARFYAFSGKILHDGCPEQIAKTLGGRDAPQRQLFLPRMSAAGLHGEKNFAAAI